MITLSYIFATKNRLPYLTIALSRLISIINSDEEIIVVDGNSTDGTKEYLEQLFAEGKITRFISEPDHNQAQAWNKGLLMANGAVIKKIIDDDVHDYEAIRSCANYMAQHPSVDVCISDNLECNLLNHSEIAKSSRLPWFLRWKKGEINTFTFSDVSMLIRKSALSYIGLYDTQFKMLDWEYALRITFLKVNIAYCEGCNSLAVTTPGNVSSTANKELFKSEAAIGKAKYGYPGDQSETSFYSHIKIAIGTFLHNLKNKPAVNASTPAGDELRRIYDELYSKLEEYNKTGEHQIIS